VNLNRKKIRGRILFGLVILGVAAISIPLFRPSPLRVEVVRVRRGPLRVTIDQEGETRTHDRFLIAAPVPGRLLRVELEEGDPVKTGAIVARLEPLPLNQREREELMARIQSAEAAKHQADARVAHAREDREQARRDRDRAESLAKDGVISVQALEQTRNADITLANELDAAIFNAQAAASEVLVAKAGLVSLRTPQGQISPVIELRSPVAGRVLRINEKSERVIPAGTRIIELGDPAQLEVVADVLSTDAVKIQPGDPVLLEGWGGDHAIRARVRLIEPAGFTKVSALGVEEKRVNIIADFVDSPGPLRDGYRVEAQVVIWEGTNVLQVPSSAVFRRGETWTTFIVESGHAQWRPIEIGHLGEFATEILDGLKEGDTVIVHPPNELNAGSRIQTK
jgi:HlyD family secretion protein